MELFFHNLTETRSTPYIIVGQHWFKIDAKGEGHVQNLLSVV